MPRTTQELAEAISAIEPTEQMYASLTTEDVPGLQELVANAEPWLAARAIFALARLSAAAPEASLSVRSAASDPRVEIRVAVAASAALLPNSQGAQLLTALLDDSDVGVRKFSIES